MNPEILYEDNHIIAVLKPAGLLTQGDISGAPSLLDILKGYIKERDNKPGNVYLGMVQRLDQPVSGVIIFAKTSKAASRLCSQIRDRRVGKLYVTVTGTVGADRQVSDGWQEIDNHLLRVKDKSVVVTPAAKGSQRAILRIKTLHQNDQYMIHVISLITGRKHQIRAQLCHRGISICGDKKYGSHQQYGVDTGIALHALGCTFQHPVRGDQVSVSAPLPGFFMKSFWSADEAEKIQPLLDREIQSFSGG